MTYLIVALALIPTLALVAFAIHTNRRAKHLDAEETARFRAMTAAERQDALVKYKRHRTTAREERNTASRLYSGYRWGYRHNPYRTRYAIAQAQYVAANDSVRKLEGIITELDGGSN